MENRYNYFLISPNNSELYLISECYINDCFYRAIHKLEKNNIDIEKINCDKEFKNAKYEYIKRDFEIEEENIFINLNCNIEFDNGDKVNFTINKKFIKEEIYKSQFDYLDKLDNKFLMKYINIYLNILKDDSKFVNDNINNLFELNKIIEKNIVKKNSIKPNDYTIKNKMDINTIISFAQSFLNENNINIDINRLIEDGSINFIDDIKNENRQGVSYYKDNKKMIDVNNSNNILELCILIHELMHYYNQPDDNVRSEASEYLTEAVSYGYELILLDKFLDSEYREDAEFIYYNIVFSLGHLSFDLYSPLLSLKIFLENGKLKKEEIEKYLQLENYIDEMKKFIMNKKKFSSSVWNMIGYYLGMYNYIEYKKDNKFKEKLLEFNNSINNKNIKECLKIIGINNLSDIFDKCINNLDEYINNFNIEKNNKQLVKKLI